MNGGAGPGAGCPVPGGLPGLLFRRLYGGGYDLHSAGGVHVAVPKGNPRLRGRHLKRGRLADQRARQREGCPVTGEPPPGGIRLLTAALPELPPRAPRSAQRTCLACQMADPPPDMTCRLGRDHRVGIAAGCPGCGRLMAACALRPCSARRASRRAR